MTATERAKAINQETAEWIAADPTSRGGGMLVTDEAHWSEYGITTGPQLDAYLAWNDYVDTYKDIHGIKPRWTSWEDDTAVGWANQLKDLYGFIKFQEECRLEEEERVARAWAAARGPVISLTHNPFASLKLG